MSNYYFSAIISTGDSMFGGASLYFDGNDYIYTQGNKEFNFGTDNFNVEMWLKPDPFTPSSGTTGAYGIIATTAAPTDNVGFLLAINPNYTIHWAVGNSTNWAYSNTSTRSLASNGWSHIALTRERDTVGLYINGELENFRNVSGLSLNNTNNRIQIGGRSLQNQYYKGYIDELRITTGVSRYSKFNTNYEFYTNEDPYYLNTTLLFDYENNQVQDLSLQNNKCIISGDSFISDLQSFLGKPSLILGTKTGFVEINSGSESFNFGTGDFTIESWIHPINSLNLNYIPIIETRNNPSTNTSFTFGISRVGGTYLLDFFPRSGGAERLYSNSSIPMNTWSFITVTRKNGNCSMFINGLKQSNTIQVSRNINCENISPIIGLSKDQEYFDGYINDFRITKSCRYSESFDYPRISLFKGNAMDPYYENTSVTLNMSLQSSNANKVIIDESRNNFPISGNGLFSISQSGSKFGNGCLELNTGIGSFNNSGGYISIANSDVFNFENKDFTIEFWYRRKSGIIGGTQNAGTCCPGWYGRFFTTYASGGDFNDPKDAYINYGGINILMEANSNNGSVYFRNDGNSNFISGNLTMGFIPEDWTYYVLMRRLDTIALFKSGIAMSSINVGNRNIFNNASGNRYSPTVNIGGTSEGYHSLNGFMDSFRITKGYARYENMFTGLNNIQLSEFTNLININKFYDDEIISLEMDQIDGIYNGPVNSAKKISISDNGAAYFNGSGYLQIIPNNGFDFNTGDFTIDFWFKNLSSNNSGIIFQTTSGNNFCSVSIFLSGNNNVFSNFSFLGNSWNTFLNLGSAQSGIWNHYAVLRNTGSFLAYKNGSLVDQKSNFNNSLFWNQESVPVIGGNQSSRCILGLIDEFRITSGFARYNKNFVPNNNIDTSPNDDKYYYNNILTLPFTFKNSQTINDYSVTPKTIVNVNNIKTVDNIKFKLLQFTTPPAPPTPPGSGEPYSDYVTLLLHFNN